MFSRLMPREGKFFDLFNAHAAHIVEGGRALALLFTNFEAAAVHAASIDYWEMIVAFIEGKCELCPCAGVIQT